MKTIYKKVLFLSLFIVLLISSKAYANNMVIKTHDDCDLLLDKITKNDDLYVNKHENEAKLYELLEICPKHSGMILMLVNIKISLGDNKSALKHVDELLGVDPNNSEAIHVKGMIFSMLGEADASLRLLMASLELDPNNIDFLVNYCSTLELFSKYEEAIKVCSKAIQHGDAPPVVFYIRGRSYAALGKAELANKDFVIAKKSKDQKGQTQLK